MQVRAQQNDTIDLLVWRHLGSTSGYVEETLRLNPSLSQHGPILPHGTLVELPAPQASTPKTHAIVQLWD